MLLIRSDHGLYPRFSLKTEAYIVNLHNIFSVSDQFLDIPNTEFKQCVNKCENLSFLR